MRAGSTGTPPPRPSTNSATRGPRSALRSCGLWSGTAETATSLPPESLTRVVVDHLSDRPLVHRIELPILLIELIHDGVHGRAIDTRCHVSSSFEGADLSPHRAVRNEFLDSLGQVAHGRLVRGFFPRQRVSRYAV